MVQSKIEIPVSQCVAVVVDPTNKKFGQIATILVHFWSEDGSLLLQFDGNETDFLYDGLMKNGPPPQAIVLEKNDSRVGELIHRLPEIKGRLKSLKKVFVSGKEEEQKQIRSQFGQLLFPDEK